jgi:hypothetical protein
VRWERERERRKEEGARGERSEVNDGWENISKNKR